MANYGIVMNNTNPDMRSQNIRVVDNVIDTAKYGGIFVIGTGHLVARNRLLNLNTAHCGCYFQAGEPDLLAAGIYLGKGAERAGSGAREYGRGERDQRVRDGRQVRGERTWRGSECDSREPLPDRSSTCPSERRTSMAFSIWRSWPARKSAGPLST